MEEEYTKEEVAERIGEEVETILQHFEEKDPHEIAVEQLDTNPVSDPNLVPHTDPRPLRR